MRIWDWFFSWRVGILFVCPAVRVKGSEKGLNESDDLGTTWGPVAPKGNSQLDFPESHLTSPLYFAIWLLVSECLVNITMDTVLPDGFLTFAPQCR